MDLKHLGGIKKNGFIIVSKILSFEKKINKSIIKKPNYELLDNFNSFKKKGTYFKQNVL